MAWNTMRDLTVGDVVTESDMDTIRNNIEYLLTPNHQEVNISTTNTTSTTFVDIAGASVNLATNGGLVRAQFVAQLTESGGPIQAQFRFVVDGVNKQAYTVLVRYGYNIPVLITIPYQEVLSAGTHNIKLQWLASVGTLTLVAGQLFAAES